MKKVDGEPNGPKGPSLKISEFLKIWPFILCHFFSTFRFSAYCDTIGPVVPRMAESQMA